MNCSVTLTLLSLVLCLTLWPNLAVTKEGDCRAEDLSCDIKQISKDSQQHDGLAIPSLP
ncbi:hypothetical protein PGTUg99_016850 [Puccinia graminis f. sp. tritici]|uniref:Uncharacterized protein n=1 Tax=Puccinia graminis f. sp. tritici TaxID=56615 RepID=A0A5B0RIG6_PUCGR|nr:hypothetical protein PGTUg99_016850 [Puccinia graminis f. sp. tritici]